jgi:tocopherol cyclase
MSISVLSTGSLHHPYSKSVHTTSARPSYKSIRNLRFPNRPHFIAIHSLSNPDSEFSSEVKESPQPVYVPPHPNRHLRTPHSGYHFDGSTRKFFEGWYFKVSIPERRQSFCFTFSVENPSFQKKLSKFEEAQYGPRFTGVGAQILGADDKYICQYTENSQRFWASKLSWFLEKDLVTLESQKLSFIFPSNKNRHSNNHRSY